MDIEMLDVPEQGHTSEQEKDVDMMEVPEEGHPLDELEPRIIESKPNATPMEEKKTFLVNPEDPIQKRRVLNSELYETSKKKSINSAAAALSGNLSTRSGYPTRIDQLVDSTAGYELLSFMDAYSGYDQILMFRPDEESTSFITDRGLYYYKVMSFGLKNAGVTYQKLVNMMFAKLIGKTMEIYVDDMLVKSLQAKEHIYCEPKRNRGEFGKDNGPTRNEVTLEAKGSTKPKWSNSHTQSLHFRGTNKSLPFFKVLKQGKKFQWTSECEEAFQALKKHLGETPLLSKPQPREPLLLYLAISDEAISAVLVREENTHQLPVYYISKALLPAEARYPDMEKLALSLVTASRKLRPYFQSAIKGQALVDFMAEFVKVPEMEATMETTEPPTWSLFVDGSSGENGSRAGVVLESPEGHKQNCIVRFGFKASNNAAEYEAFLVGLRLAKEIQVKRHLASNDSQLVVSQVNKRFAAKDTSMTAYLKLVMNLILHYERFKLVQVPCLENTHANALSKLASSRDSKLLKIVPIERLLKPSISGGKEVLWIEGIPLWMQPIVAYLKDQSLPASKNERKKLRRRAAHFVLQDDVLYKRGYTSPLL
ncbi:uncharacterized protein LOC111406442 [Olea europaea var. sylvestris]|uniref:uncharacterized protein LOC111406442 n=1 Tax=Olea europaea var. sylvestris TaxID=158386 RepID=UPI000C1D6663|nr:uncharacterized protein LOC111406442 [Olea europaea var. sylvestris]